MVVVGWLSDSHMLPERINAKKKRKKSSTPNIKVLTLSLFLVFLLLVQVVLGGKDFKAFPGGICFFCLFAASNLQFVQAIDLLHRS